MLGLLGLVLFFGYVSYRRTDGASTAGSHSHHGAIGGDFGPGSHPDRGSKDHLPWSARRSSLRRDGNGEIYLAAPSPKGVEYTNLTLSNPAEDSAPAWSPDGAGLLSIQPDR